MHCALLTKDSQVELWNYLGREKFSDDFTISIFTDIEEFYSYTYKNQFGNKIDFVLIDFSAIQFDIINPYRLFLREGILLPVVMYNDPFPAPGDMASYWAIKNEDYFYPIFTVKKLSPFMPVWRKIQNVLNSSEINPYVSSICREKKFAPDGTSFDPEFFIKKCSVPKQKAVLFEYLYERKNEKVSERELCNLLWKEDSPSKRKHLFTCMHYLRKILEVNLVHQVKIIRCSRENYSLVEIPD